MVRDHLKPCPVARRGRRAAVAATLAILAGCQAPAERSPAAAGLQEVSITEAERAERAERIRAYFKEQMKRQEVVATTVTRSGQTIDWIRPESQVEGGRVATPPDKRTVAKAEQGQPRNPLLDSKPEQRRLDRSARTELQLDERARGPAGTVPVVRFDVERYLKETTIPPRDPRDVLQKILPPSPDSNDRYYAVWQRFGSFFGTAGRVNVWDVAGPDNDETSIAQTAVIRGTPMQAIEAGKIEYQALNGDLAPHFFTFFRTNGSATGDWVGGYNTLVKGWVQHSQRVAPGMSITAWNSASGGNQFSLDVEVRLHQGNWWVWAAGEWAGYYPQCVGGGAAPCSRGTLFSANGIRDQADRLDWYGEIFDSVAPKPTSTDMGSGALAAGGWQRAAYFRNITYYWAPTTYWWWDSGSVTTTDTGCYDSAGPFYSADPSWRNWFFYGGPGKEARTCR